MKLKSILIFVLSLQVAAEPVYAVTLSKKLEALNPFVTNAQAQDLGETAAVQTLLDEGAKLYREDKWAEAIEVWQKVLLIDPNNKKALRYIDRAKTKLNQTAEEPPAVMTKTDAKPSPEEEKKQSAGNLLRDGILLYREGKYSEAVKVWNQVLVLEPDNEKAKRYIERALKKQAELSPAKAAAEPTPPPPAPPAPKPKVKVAEKKMAEPKPVPEPEIKPEPKKEKTAKELLEEGKKLYRKEMFADAILRWEKVLTMEPGNQAAKRYIKRAKEKIGKMVEEDKQQEMVPKPKPEPKMAQQPVAPKQITALPAKEKKGEPETRGILPSDKSTAISIRGLTKIKTVNGEIHDYGLLSLEEIVKLGLANHGPSKVAREEVKLAKMRLIEARRARYPGVNLKNGVTEGVSTDENFEGLEFTAEFQLPIMTGGRIKNSIRQAEANVAVSMKNYEKTRADFIAEIEQAYYALSNGKKVYRDRLQLFKEADQALQLIRKQFNIGLARQLDLLNIENQYNDVAFQVTSAEKDLELAYLTLKQLMNLEENEIFDIEELESYAVMDIDYDSTLEIALKRKPDIKLAELQVLFNKYAVKVAEAQDRFRVEMNASVGLNDQFFVESDTLDLQTEYFVGIRATKPLGLHTIDNNFIIQDRVPAAGQTTSSKFGSNTVTLQLFNNTAKTGVTEAKIQYLRAKGELKNAIKTTKFEVRQNYFEYQKALTQLDGAITRLNLGEEEVKILKAQAELNQAQLIDVLRAVVRKYESRGNLAQAVTSYYTAMSNLNKAIGITGYFNPVTGKISEELHNQLFQPINKPRYKIFTQLTKDKMGEDILSYRPEDVTADALLAKERKEERAFNDKWILLGPLGIVPGVKELVTPDETKKGFLNSIDLPPEKPLKPFKPWQFLRWPVLGLLEYEPVLDPVENNFKPQPKIERTQTQPDTEDVAPDKPPMPAESQIQRQNEKTKPVLHKAEEIKLGYRPDPNIQPEISSIKLIEGPESVKIVIAKKGFLDLASYWMDKPDRLLFVFRTPAEISGKISSVEVDNAFVKSIRLKKKDSMLSAFIVDFKNKRPYKVLDEKEALVVNIEK